MAEVSKPLGEVVDAGPHWRRYTCESCGHTWEPTFTPQGWVLLEREEDRHCRYKRLHCPKCQVEDASPESDTRATFTDGPLMQRMRGAS